MGICENANYAAWQVCRDANVDLSFTLYDRATVERLIRDNPQLLPMPNVDIPADLRWNQRHIRDEIVKGIFTGDSIPDIARRLQNVSDMDYRAAVRNARTATTGAQNAGRVHRYQQAEGMGIHLQKKWLSTLDNRTRHEHRLLDGQTCKNGKKFRVEGMEIEYPGDPTAPGRLVYNCRCTLIADIEGVDGTVKNRHSRLNGKSYEQWKYELATDINSTTTKILVQSSAAITDVTDEYYKNASDKGGTIKYSKGYAMVQHKDEIEVVQRINDQFGGKFVMLAEDNGQNVKTPDFIWNGRMWEIKSITSEKAVDSALRKAIKQIEQKPGGVVIHCVNSMNNQNLISLIDDRARRSAKIDFDIMILDNNNAVKVLRYKK